MIVEKLDLRTQADIRQSPSHTNRASQLGHECMRYLVYERTRWTERQMHDVSLQRRFELGNWFERMIIARMEEAGITVIEQQRPYYLPDYNISGHIDGKVVINGKHIPFDIKTTTTQTLATIQTIDDMRKHRHHYIRMYPAQIQLYMHMGNDPDGLFLFVDRVSGAYREIPVEYDIQEAQALLEKARDINIHVTAGTIPEPIQYDEEICGYCGYRHICGNEVVRNGISITDDTELEEMITRWAELKPAAAEYHELDNLIKAKTKGVESAIVGRWLVRGRWVETTRYTIPDDVKQQYAERVRIWRKEIVGL